jgi:excisionase family DNA binding protein
MECLLSIEQVAKSLGISVHTVKKMLATHQLRRTKVGRRTLIRESQLQRVIKDEPTDPGESALCEGLGIPHKESAKKTKEIHGGHD